jgi:hypothetical protein
MKQRMRYFIDIILAIVISSPLSVFILLLSEYVMNPQAYKENLAYSLGGYIIFPFAFGIVYIIIGIPTTLLADYLKKNELLVSFFKKSYFLQCVIFTSSSFLFSYLSLCFHVYLPAFLSWLIPALIYLHMLILIRWKRGNLE